MSSTSPTAPATPALLYWEDFPPGAVLDCGALSVDRDDVIDFARRYDPQPFHVDEAAAARTHFGGLVASGWHTAALAMRMMCDGYLRRAASLGSPGIDKLAWPAPVRPGDNLSMRMTVLSARPMRSKPHIGLVESRWEMFNQHGELVLDMRGWGMFGRRDAGAAPG